MNARGDALHEMTHGHLYLDNERAGALLDAYRAEVLREAAASIRRWADANEKHLLEGERTGARMAANHIATPDRPPGVSRPPGGRTILSG